MRLIANLDIAVTVRFSPFSLLTGRWTQSVADSLLTGWSIDRVLSLAGRWTQKSSLAGRARGHSATRQPLARHPHDATTPTHPQSHLPPTVATQPQTRNTNTQHTQTKQSKEKQTKHRKLVVCEQNMRAAIVKSFGPINDVISVADNVPKPVRGTGKASDKHMIIKVLACSPSPGDRRAVSGSVSLIRSPKTWPYIPGHDVCGIVEEVPPGNINFRKGDCVISTSPAIFMKDGLAEYAPVAISHSAVKPQGTRWSVPPVAIVIGTFWVPCACLKLLLCLDVFAQTICQRSTAHLMLSYYIQLFAGD
jgi:hypothetical protein